MLGLEDPAPVREAVRDKNSELWPWTMHLPACTKKDTKCSNLCLYSYMKSTSSKNRTNASAMAVRVCLDQSKMNIFMYIFISPATFVWTQVPKQLYTIHTSV